MATRLEDLPYKKSFPTSMTPVMSSIWLTYLGLVASLMWAVFLSRLSLIDWETYQRMSVGPNGDAGPTLAERLAIWGFASSPWLGMLWGGFVGTLLTIRLNAHLRANLDYYSERLIRHNRMAIQGISNRRLWTQCGLVAAFVFVDLAGAFVLNVNPKTSMLALLIPAFLSFQVHRDIYGLGMDKYAAALETGLIREGSLRPGWKQRLNMAVPLILSVVIPLLFCISLKAHWNELGEFRDLMLSTEGITCTPEEAQALEMRLEDDPDNREARLLLIAYYGSARFEAPEADQKPLREAYYRHTLWFVEHSPETWESILLFPRDGDAYEEARRLWLENTETHAGNPKALMNAAKFFDSTDPGLAEEILQKGQALEPDNPEWGEKLSKLRLERQNREMEDKAEDRATDRRESPS